MVFHEVTGFKKLDRIRRDFVANVSHEIKTPLTTIHGYVETLADGALEDPTTNRKFLGKIRDSARRLSALATDLLALAQAEVLETQPALTEIDLPPLVREAAARREGVIRAKNQSLSLDPIYSPAF